MVYQDITYDQFEPDYLTCIYTLHSKPIVFMCYWYATPTFGMQQLTYIYKAKFQVIHLYVLKVFMPDSTYLQLYIFAIILHYGLTTKTSKNVVSQA